MAAQNGRQLSKTKSDVEKFCLKLSILKTNILCQTMRWFSGTVIHILLPELSNKVM